MSNFKIDYQNYFWYKFVNSIFNGLSVGAIFTIYAPLEPSIFSIGGILLAVGLIIVAKFYDKLIQIDKFFWVSLFVEVVILSVIILFLSIGFDYMVALSIYLGYQISFIFGSYLVRAETLFVSDKALLSKLDIYKQSGYLCGLATSWVFYKILENFYNITTNNDKVFYLHILLLFVEILTIFLIFKSFKSNN
jgi:hypothetical protein